MKPKFAKVTTSPSDVRQRKVRRMLDAIDRFLTTPANLRDGTSRKLWLVLSALRGPDSNSRAIKDQITIPIRRAVFPRIAADVSAEYTIGACFSSYPTKRDPNLEDASLHFMSHARSAFELLGLDWRNRK